MPSRILSCGVVLCCVVSCRVSCNLLNILIFIGVFLYTHKDDVDSKLAMQPLFMYPTLSTFLGDLKDAQRVSIILLINQNLII